MDIETLLKSGESSAFYRLASPVEIDTIESLSGRYGYRFAHLPGKRVENMETFFSLISEAMVFPTLVRGWDACFDWLRDLSWFQVQKHVLLYDDFDHFAHVDSETFQMTIKICRDAVNELNRVQRKGFAVPKLYVLLKGDPVLIPGVELLD